MPLGNPCSSAIRGKRTVFALIAAAASLLAGCGGGSGTAVHRGELVSFSPTQAFVDRCGATPGRLYQARIVGLPGDTVTVTGQGRAIVDGKPLAEPYAISRAPQSGQPAPRAGTWHVPDDAYFLLGDDRRRACDSRVYGAVPAANLQP